MRIFLVAPLTFFMHHAFAQGRVELCRCETATVYTRLFKMDEVADGDNYNVNVEVENDSFDNLYYSRKVRIQASEKDPLIPPYLTISVLNPGGTNKDNQYYIHGAITMHFSSDSTQIFKVTMKRNEYDFKIKIKKGEPPQLRCFFNEYLIPWEKVKVLKIRLKP